LFRSERCVLRLRYNISTGEFGPNQGFGGNTALAGERSI
jgi:hypothetical protein